MYLWFEKRLFCKKDKINLKIYIENCLQKWMVPFIHVHEGTVVKKDDKGATVQLQYGLEAYSPARHLRTEDEKPINVEDVKEFMIIEFDRSEKRILVSHTRVWEKQQAEEKQAVVKEKRDEADKTRKAVKNIQGKVEKATLGDLGALAELREKLKQSEGGEEKSAQ